MSQRAPTQSSGVSSVAHVSLPTTIDSLSGPHQLECLIQRGLQAHPGLKFSRLTVHKCPQGVCLEGLLETNEDNLDLCELVNEIAGVDAINHVVMPRVVPK